MEGFVSYKSYEYCDFGEDSDDERAESSEDEIDILLHGTPEQRRRLRHSQQKQQQTAGSRRPIQHHSLQEDAASSEDEFEREMNAELDKTVHMLEQARGKQQKAPDKSVPSAAGKKESADNKAAAGASTSASSEFYDDIYFDSDDEDNFEGEGEARVKRHHAKPSNDDLLYDPDMDDEDQRWMDRQRQLHHGHNPDALQGGGVEGTKKRKGAVNSDAILDCPACLTTLCIDCQRHEIYPQQFRAMFVMNCKVDTKELLRVPEQAPKKKAKKFKKASTATPDTASASGGGERASGSGAVADDNKDKFHPVKCEECDTVVGVIDMDEVYHFFNVLTSQP